MNYYRSILATQGSFLNKFDDADLALSLQNLNGVSSSDVIRSRRSSDNAESDFTANEVKNGTLYDWAVSPTAQSLFNNSMWFDGVNDHIRLNDITLSGARTIRAERVYYTGGGSSFSVLWANGTAAYRVWVNASGAINLNSTETIGVNVPLSQFFDIEVDYNASGQGVAVRIDGDTVWTGTAAAGVTGSGNNQFAVGARITSNNAGGFFQGVIKKVSVSGILSWEGDGNQNSNWEDQIGSNDGTVNGSPDLFTGQGFNAFVPKWYDQTVDRSNQKMWFDGVDDEVAKSFTIGSNDTLSWKGTSSGFFHYLFSGTNTSNRIWRTSSNLNFSIGSSTIHSFALPVELDTSLVNKYALERSGSTVRLYINDEFINEITGVSTANLNITRIGYPDFVSSADHFTGVLFDLRNNDTLIASGDDTTSGAWGGGTVIGSPELAYKVLNENNYRLPRDATQTTAGNQPMIVQNGELCRGSNGLPEIRFISADGHHLALPKWANPLALSNHTFAIATVVRPNALANNIYFGHYSTTDNQRSQRYGFDNTGEFRGQFSQTGSVTPFVTAAGGSYSANTDILIQWQLKLLSGNLDIENWVNNSNISLLESSTITEIYNSTATPVIGGNSVETTPSSFTGGMQLFLAWRKDVTTEQEDISKAINKLTKTY